MSTSVLRQLMAAMLVLCMGMVGAGCHPAALPTATFSVSVTSGNAPLAVTFTDESTSGNPILMWAWDFGDGTTSNVANPVHTYNEPGSYTVTLTVTSVDGVSTETQQDVIVVGQDTSVPTSSFSAAPISGRTPHTVDFVDNSIAGGAEIRGWYWQFGDGRISQEQNPSHTYTVAGTYSVSLRTFNLYGGDTLVREDLIIAVEPGTVGPCFPDADDEAPIITTCPDTVELTRDDTCSATVPDLANRVAAIDNCGIQEIRQQPPVGTVITEVTPASLRVIDTSGNSTLCTFDLVPVDETPPVILSCPEDRTLETDENCNVFVPDLTGELEASDNCDTITVTQSPKAGSTIFIPTDVTLTVRDSAGNQSTCVTNINVVDVTAPTIEECPTPTPLVVDEFCRATLPDLRDGVVASDFCVSSLSITQSPQPGTEISSETVVRFIVTDGQGNDAVCEVTQTLSDEIAPEIVTCPADRTLELSDSCTAVLPDMRNEVFATDNCTFLTVTQSPEPGTTISEATEVVFRATDNAGNDDVCSVLISVADTTDPVITTCPAPRTLELLGQCEAFVVNLIPDVVATDNCSIASITQSPLPGTRIPEDTFVTITVTDTAGNTDTCSVALTVQDSIAPTTSSCPGELTVPGDANCRGVLPDFTLTISADDNCEVASYVQSPAPGLVITSPTALTLTVTDTSGNETVCNTIVSVADVTPPTINSCPADFTLETGDDCTALMPDLSAEVVATDNCSGIEVTQDPEAGTEISEETVVTLFATDDAGNTSECELTVTLEDTEAPEFTSCPSGTTLQLGDACTINLPNFANQAAATDNCRLDLITQSPAPGTAISTDTTITLTATDTSGNEAFCTLQVIVEDSIPPTITSCTDRVVLPVDTNCEAVVPDLTANVVATDNCAIASITQSVAVDTVITETIAVDLVVTDSSGNTSICPVQVVPETCASNSDTQTPVGTVVSLTHTPAGGDNYQPNSTFDVHVRIDRLGNETIRNLMLDETIPAGWSFAGVVEGFLPDTTPALDAVDTLSFGWDVAPDFPTEFVYRLNVPGSATDIEVVSGTLFYETGAAKGILASNTEELFIPLDQTVVYYDRSFPERQVYLPGIPLLVSIDLRVSDAGSLSTFTATETLPPGFTFQGIVEPTENVTAPANGATSEVEITLTNGFTAATQIRYLATPTPGTTGTVLFEGEGSYPFDASTFPTNRKQSYVPQGVPGALVLDEVTPNNAPFNTPSPVTLTGDFDVTYDAGTMEMYFSAVPGIVDPANDFVAAIADGDVAELEILATTPAVDTPFDTTLYLRAEADGVELLSNTVPFIFAACDTTGQAQPITTSSQMELRRRILGSEAYTPGSPTRVEIELFVVGGELVTALGHEETIPNDLFYDANESGCVPQLTPFAGTNGLLSFAWFAVPSLPVRFAYDLDIPAPTVGVKRIVGDGVFRTGSGEIRSNFTTTLITGEDSILTTDRSGVVLTSADTAVEISIRIEKTGDADLESFTLTETLPDGWTFGGLAGGNIPETTPALDATGALEFDFSATTSFPFVLEYLAVPPVDQENAERIESSYDFKFVDENEVLDVFNDTIIVVE